MIKIGEIYTVNTGIVAKRKEAVPGVGCFVYKMLTLKSIDQRGFINDMELDEFLSGEELDEKYLTQYGDIIVRLSIPFTAVVVSEDQVGIVVPSLFAILRTNRCDILSDYMALYFNSEIMKRQYIKDASGSALQSIKTSSIKDYQIKVIDYAMQEKVVELNKLMIKEEILLEKLIANKRIYNNGMINAVLKGDHLNG